MKQTLASIVLLIIFIPISIMLGGFAVFYYAHYSGEPPLNIFWLFWNQGSALEKMWLMSFSLIIYSLFALFTFAALIRYFIKQKRMVYGKAKLANIFDIKKAGLLKENRGLFFGYFNDRPLFDNSQLHTLLVAESGTGKGVSLIIPNLFLWSGSVICTDMKGENFEITSGYRQSKGQKVFCFDPFSTKTHRINPLAYINPENPIDHLQRIAYIVWPDNEKGEKIWSASARALFIGIGLLIYLEDGSDFLTFANIISTQAMINYKQLDKRISNLEGKETLISRCWQLLKEHANTPDKTRGGFEAEFRSALDIFMNPSVAWATSANDVPLDHLRKEPISLYLNVVPSNISRVSFIMRMIMETVNMLNTQEEFSANNEFKYQLLLLNDEQHNFFGAMPLLMKAASFYRSYGIRIFSVYQSIAQINLDYGKDGAQAYLDNHHIKVYYCPMDKEKARKFAAEIGETTVFTKSKSRGKGGTNTSEAPQKREAFLPEELMKMLGKKYGLMFVAGSNAIKFKKTVWHEQKEFTSRRLQPVVLPNPSNDEIEKFLSQHNINNQHKIEQIKKTEKDPIKVLKILEESGASDEELGAQINSLLINGSTE